MIRLVWRPMAYEDRAAIMDYIALDNPGAALELDEEIEAKTNVLVSHPKLYKPGRMKGTREMVIRPNYVVVYREMSAEVTILRVLHAARQWP
ncbi:type II toxin-antitoxin system RelE/ParE family toxin [Quatrionicoccus australiensis]|uniref:type II toxin-antitoxin system RelE/ParE family toxin n=1 Tax=Quatrionicoccus australiensis TaxID=138118 RepID=UPI001CF975D2|nr:type II toxin-antitoxin system RelE/ParE family toxin [Quatrionicoccus australiensis]MCB4362059.1 type II toxin-antitoxin system RelE/ParE family toxin [Quatrionicoccus australiensis]